jgi:hypothetical protein
MEKECKICKVVKLFNDFPTCKKCINGCTNICKLCKKQGKTITELDYKTPKFNIKWSKRDDNFMRMFVVSKQDYKSMYNLMASIGYNVEEDIHKQFVDKLNSRLDKPVKYKKRPSNSINHYLSNGEVNPNYKKQKKNPTD